MSTTISLNYCPNCGTKTMPEAKFCSECGYQIEKLRQLINEAQNQEKETQNNENNNQHLTEVEDTFENEEIIQDKKPQNQSVNDIELVRPNYNENNQINQDQIPDEKDMETETIQIQVGDDSNDFDIIRPNSQNDGKKHPKDFSILNRNNKQ